MAIPQEECDGMCSIDMDSHQCAEMVAMSCCDTMGMNNNIPSCGREVTENSCDFEYEPLEIFTFIIPKTEHLYENIAYG